MSVQMALGAPATRVASRKLGPVAGRRESPPRQRGGRLGDEHVGEHVGQVRDGGQDAVVGVGVDRGGPRADPVQEPVQALVEHARGAGAGGQVPGGRLEQVGASVLDTGVLGSGQGMAADEAGIVVGSDHLALGGAHVGDHAVRRRGGERLAHQRRQAADGHGHEHRLGIGDGGRDRAARAVQRAELERALQRLGRIVVSGHLGAEALARRQGHRAADQPDAENREPHRLTAASRPRGGACAPRLPDRRAPRRWCPNRCSRR